ncbi:TrmB family transcriptional regulator [Candidatus Pacearchaeota archaeon]|nr:TrmB family transcriptional regulator [Candidatus Pacearchaeota archaeon]
MTTMELSELMKLGFNRNEARVYLALVKFGKADARMIIKETKFHKNIVYDNLDKLIDKGLVGFIIEGKKRRFQIASSNSLVKFFEDEEKELEEKKKSAELISKEINKIAKHLPEKQEASIFRGIKGIRAFYNETLKGEDYVVFGAPQESISIMGELFWENYNLKRIENKLSVRMIFNPSIRYHGKKLVNKHTKIKYFEGDFEPSTETHIQGNKVGIIVWGESPVLFLIEDKKVAESYLKFFEKMWKSAKK